MKDLFPSLPCEVANLSCWKNLTAKIANETSQTGKQKIKEAKDFAE